MFSTTEVLVTQIVIVASCSNQSTTNLPQFTNLPKFMIEFQKQNLFKNIISKAISAFAQSNSSKC